jgi:hypothetical protein
MRVDERGHHQAGDEGDVMAVHATGAVAVVDIKTDRDIGYLAPILCSDIEPIG